MKKSIKYAGIAAATLLAVAPVAAPVVSQAADADTTVSDTDANVASKELNSFKGQFGDIDTSDTVVSAIQNNKYFGSDNAAPIATVQENSTGLMKSALESANVDYSKLTQLNTYVYFTASDASGKTYNGVTDGQTPAELAKTMGLNSRMPVTINVHFTSHDLDTTLNQNAGASDFSFKINSVENNELNTVNAKFDTPISVAKNSKVLATQLVNTNDVTLTDQDGKSVLVDNVKFGNGYFTSYTAAMNAAKVTSPAYDPDTAQGNVGTTDINNGEFKTPGTYYQVVSFTAKKGSALESFIKAYTDSDSVNSGYSVYVNGKKASAGYDFTATYLSGSQRQRINFVRAINVSDSEAQWTTTENKGIVTTKADTPYYTLNDDAGNKITNRALAKNTAWVTDQKRVDQNGNTQYRVATGEWIDANDVTFSDKATTDEGEYTDVQALNGKVTLDGPSSFIYMLYNDNGESVSNRALAGDSAWYTDKKATNAAGVTVYHVATGEWVQAGSGVNYVAY